MGASIFDVAKYILTKYGDMSTMKLQKLCYYCQSWALVWNDQPLFENKFYAWVNGPVSPELFKQTQGKFKVTANDEPGNTDNLSNLEKETIDVVVEYYLPHDAQWLSRLSHMEDPWKNTRINEEITQEKMALYYSSL